MAATSRKRKAPAAATTAKGSKAKRSKSGAAGPAKSPKAGGKNAKSTGADAKKNQQKKKKAHGASAANGAQQKKTQQKKSSQPEEEEVEVDEDDVAFFEENAQFTNFLVNMDAKRLSKGMFTKEKPPRPAPKKPAENKTKEEQENEDAQDEPLEKLEARPRRSGWNGNASKTDLSGKLPVKFMDGSVRLNKLLTEDTATNKEAEGDAEEEEDEEEEEVEEEEVDGDNQEKDSDVSDMEFEEVQTNDGAQTNETATLMSEVDLQVQRQRRLAAKKVEIAQLCESILESPESGLKKNKEHGRGFSKLQELHALCSDPDPTVQKLSLLSQLSVYLDILPDYRIRLQTESEKQAQNGGGNNHGRPMKKKVQQIQDFEASMLNNYQIYLKHCAYMVKQGVQNKTPESPAMRTLQGKRGLALAETAVRCLAELLKVKYAFNFHLNLIIALVPMADSAFPSIRQAACDAFVTVFQTDKSCTSSLDIVKQVSSYVRQREHRVKPDIIRTFLKMPLVVTMEQGESSRKKAKADRKKRRKQQDDGDNIASGLKEAEAVVDRNERDKTQADILHELVLVYFRILKQATYSTALPAVLEGLSKFAFLINLDIMIDLLKVLKAVLREDILPLPSAFQAVLTGLRTLQGPGQELMVDDKEFVDILYKLLRRFSEGEDVSSFDVALRCVEAVFLRRKEIVVDRVAAFIKRLLLTAVSLQPHQVLAVLALVRSLVHRYAKLQQLLESDVDRVAAGEYRADVDDPDFTNPYSSACWELALLARHYHPAVASFALGTAQQGPSLPNETPEALLTAYAGTQQGEFLPKVPVPPRNPLFVKLAQQQKREKNKKRQRERKFFVSDPVGEGLRAPSPFWLLCQRADEEKTVTGAKAKGKAKGKAALRFRL